MAAPDAEHDIALDKDARQIYGHGT